MYVLNECAVKAGCRQLRSESQLVKNLGISNRSAIFEPFPKETKDFLLFFLQKNGQNVGSVVAQTPQPLGEPRETTEEAASRGFRRVRRVRLRGRDGLGAGASPHWVTSFRGGSMGVGQDLACPPILRAKLIHVMRIVPLSNITIKHYL